MTARPLINTGSTVSSVPPDWFNVLDYGAKGDSDGVTPGNGTDDTSAFQSAFNAAAAANGTVYIPGPHNYRLTSSATMINTHAWRIMGSGGGEAGPTLFMDTTSNVPLIKVYSSYGWEMSNFRVTARATYPGNLIDVDGIGSGGSGADCQQWHIHDMKFDADGATTNSLLRINKAHTGQVDNCRFGSAKVQILDGGTNFWVSVKIGPNNIFNPSVSVACIQFVGDDLEMVTVSRNTFEAGINTTAVKCLTGCRFYKFLYEGNWHGDVSASIIWLDGLACQTNVHVGTIRDNYFALGGSTTAVGIKFGDASGSNNLGNWVVEGNAFLGPGNAYDGYVGSPWGTINRFNNSYQNLTAVFKAGGPTQGGVALGNYAGEAAVLEKVTKTITANLAQPNQNFQLGDIANFDATQSGVGYEAGPSFITTACLRGVDETRLRVVGGDSNGELRIWPNKVGFFGHDPASKPTITGSRGGNAALASLLTAGAGLGLWIDSTTA